MTSHVPFNREATDEFLAGFALYRNSAAQEPGERDASPWSGASSLPRGRPKMVP